MKTYTHDEVCTAANNAANLLGSIDPDTATLIDFVVNATLTLLDSTDAGIDEVLEQNWGDGDTRDDIRAIVTGGD